MVFIVFSCVQTLPGLTSLSSDSIMMTVTVLSCLISIFLLSQPAVALPAISGDKVRLEVLSGENIELPCHNLHGGVRIWSNAGRVLFAGSLRVRINSKFNMKNGNLMISDISPTDGGDFVCSMELQGGVVMNIKYELIVLEAPTVEIVEGSHLAVKLGTQLALRCTGSGVPEPEVIWRREGEILSRGLGEAGILLEYITREDAGDIVCEASNGVGDTTARDVLSLDVLYSPQVEMIQPHISFQPKCGLELQCEVHSSSEPGVSWYHNNLQLQPSEGLTIWSLENLHVLQISSCDHSIIGQFSCRATNNLGDGEAEVDISQQWLHQELEMFQQEEENINNVRRNVVHRQEHSLPLTSSSTRYSLQTLILSVTIYCLCLQL